MKSYETFIESISSYKYFQLIKYFNYWIFCPLLPLKRLNFLED